MSATPAPPTAPALPPIPATVYSLLGPVPVSVHDALEEDGTELLGVFRAFTREIRLRGGVTPTVLWHTLHHEQMHVLLWDAGVQLPEAVEESICDAYATARVAEMLARP